MSKKLNKPKNEFDSDNESQGGDGSAGGAPNRRFSDFVLTPQQILDAKQKQQEREARMRHVLQQQQEALHQEDEKKEQYNNSQKPPSTTTNSQMNEFWQHQFNKQSIRRNAGGDGEEMLLQDSQECNYSEELLDKDRNSNDDDDDDDDDNNNNNNNNNNNSNNDKEIKASKKIFSNKRGKKLPLSSSSKTPTQQRSRKNKAKVTSSINSRNKPPAPGAFAINGGNDDSDDDNLNGTEANFYTKHASSANKKGTIYNNNQKETADMSTSSHVSLPGAFQQAGLSISESSVDNRRSSAVDEVLASMATQSSNNNDSFLSTFASTSTPTPTHINSLLPSTSGENEDAVLNNNNDNKMPQAEMIDSAEPVFYAEDVAHDHSRRKKLCIVVVGIVVIIAIVCATVIAVSDDEEPQLKHKTCALERQKQNIMSQCICYNSTEWYWNEIDDLEKFNLIYSVFYYILVGQGILPPRNLNDVVASVDRYSCDDAYHVALVYMTYVIAKEADFEEFKNADVSNRSQLVLDTYGVVMLYLQTGGIDWDLDTNWIPNTIYSELCSWYGIGCFFVEILNKVNLESNNLVGTIPTEIGILTRLQELDLSYNKNLIGTIPSELIKLSNLNSLDLSGCDLTGTIPSELHVLSRLDFLSLSHNRLTGSIPPEVAKMDLRFLELQNNNLNGTLPTEFGQATNLRFLTFKKNQFSGLLPLELGQISRLETVDFSQNSFSGIAEGFHLDPPHLQYLNLLESGVGATLTDNQCAVRTLEFEHLLIIGQCTGPFAITFDKCTCCVKSTGTPPPDGTSIGVVCSDDLPQEVVDLFLL